MMLFYKYICQYILEEIPINQLIDAAIECVTNGIESDSLYILAGLDEKDEYNISLYYKLVLNELNIKEPTKYEAVKYLIKYYCNQLINRNITHEIFLKKVPREISRKYTAPNNFPYTNAAGYEFDLMKEETKYARDILGLGDLLDWKDIEYAGDFWGLERFVGIYSTIDDLEDYKEKPDEFYEKIYNIDKYNVDEYIEKMYNLCYEYAEEYLNKENKGGAKCLTPIRSYDNGVKHESALLNVLF